MGPISEHNVRPWLAYLCNILGLKGHFTLFFLFSPHILPKPLTNPVKGLCLKPQSSSSSSATASSSSLSSSSTASSSLAWSSFALMVSSKPPARWGKRRSWSVFPKPSKNRVGFFAGTEGKRQSVSLNLILLLLFPIFFFFQICIPKPSENHVLILIMDSDVKFWVDLELHMFRFLSLILVGFVCFYLVLNLGFYSFIYGWTCFWVCVCVLEKRLWEVKKEKKNATKPRNPMWKGKNKKRWRRLD